MAITQVSGQAVGESHQTGALSVAFPSNVTAGNLVVIGVWCSDTDSTDHITTSGTATLGTLTQDVAVGGSGIFYQAIYSAPVTGSGSLTIGTDISLGTACLAIDEWAGADVSGTRVADTDSIDAAAGTGQSFATPDVVTGQAGAIVGVLVFSWSYAVTITPDAAFGTIYEEEDGTTYLNGSMIVRLCASNTTDAASWTAPTASDSPGWTAVVVAYKAAAVGGPSAYAVLSMGD